MSSAEEGGTPGEWARLIDAYGVLDRPGAATRAWAGARAALGPDELTEPRRAAEGAGADLTALPAPFEPPAPPR